MTVFIQKGDAPLSVRQATKRGLRHFNAEMQQWQREAGIVTQDAAYHSWANQWLADNEVNATNNQFNHQLAAYRKATARLERVDLAVGQPEITEEQETGEFDESGNPVTETVVIQHAVEPIVAADVEYPVYDEEGTQTGTVTEPDRDVVAQLEKDAAERTAAQSVVDNTPQAVKDFG